METPAATGTPPERAPPSATAAATASTATALDTCTVQFMWQPLTEMSYPRITLLASFEVSGGCSYHSLVPSQIVMYNILCTFSTPEIRTPC